MKYKVSKYNIIIKNDDDGIILYNCYRGGIAKLRRDIWTRIIQSSFYKDEIEHFNELYQDGYIVDEQLDEYQRAKMQREERITSLYPKIVSYVIAPTLSCNLNCSYCFEKDFKKDFSNNTISQEMLDKVEQFILDENSYNNQLETVVIHWFGGEPLLCYEQILNFSQKLNIDLSRRGVQLYSRMTSNGSLLSKERIEALISKCNLNKIQITLDGMSKSYCEKKQASPAIFNRVIKNVILLTHYIKTTVRLNADRSNFEELKELVQLLYQSDINRNNLKISFAQIRNYTNDQILDSACLSDYEFWKRRKQFYEFLKQYDYYDKAVDQLPVFIPLSYCGIRTKHNFVIDFSGNLYKCEHYMGDETRKVGNVTNGIYFNTEYVKSQCFTDSIKCMECNIYPCCNYAECAVMFDLTGKEGCRCHLDQVKIIKESAIEYLNRLES